MNSEKYLYQYSNKSLEDFANDICKALKCVGCAGISGVSGYSGYSGYSGNSGYSGYSGSSSAGIVTVTCDEIHALMSGGQLVPGALYEVTEFNKNMPTGSAENPNGLFPEVLYDDGTDSGVTIYAVALTTTEMSTSGYGKFYNPIYYPYSSYFNTDGTGLYGIWDGDNPNSSQVPAYQIGDVVFWGGYAWQNIAGNVGAALSNYALNALDWLKLDYSNSNYYEPVIDEVKVVWDPCIVVERYNVKNEIKVGFNLSEYYSPLDMIQGSNPTLNPIARMAWGLYSDLDTAGYIKNGIAYVTSTDSVTETVNFKGLYFKNVNMTTSFMVDNYFGKGTEVSYLVFDTLGLCRDNVFIDGSFNDNHIWDSSWVTNNLFNIGSLNQNKLDTKSYIWYNSLYDRGVIYKNTLSGESEIYSNTLVNNGSEIGRNSLFNKSTIEQNALDNSGATSFDYCRLTGNRLDSKSSIKLNTLYIQGYMENNTLSNESVILGNSVNRSTINKNDILGESKISLNTLDYTSSIDNNHLGSISEITANPLIYGAQIAHNILNSYSRIVSCNISLNTGIWYNTLFSNSTILILTLTNSYVQNCIFNKADFSQPLNSLNAVNITDVNFKPSTNASDDLTAATVIFGPGTKDVFTNAGGVTRLMYYDALDTPVIVNFNA